MLLSGVAWSPIRISPKKAGCVFDFDSKRILGSLYPHGQSRTMGMLGFNFFFVWGGPELFKTTPDHFVFPAVMKSESIVTA
jgi:hypothetical protein